jgi:nucleotide-binding universal stress UspA family protein
MTIVCATHFTNGSFDAVKAAASLASVHGESLCLISVVPPNRLQLPAERELSDALRLHAAALTADGIEAEMELLHGTLERTVRKYCEDRAASLLVVGDSSDTSRLLSGPLHLFKDRVDVPLLVVRDPRPFDAWVKGERALKVMLALDHTWSSSVARDWMTQLAKYGPIDLVATFVWWPPDEDARRGMAKASAEDAHTAMTNVVRHELEVALKGLPDNVNWRVHLELGVGHVSDTLLAYAAREQVDLFVLGSHEVDGPLARLRSRSSVSNGVMDDAPMSVACIPSHEPSSKVPPTLAKLAGDAVR